MNALMGRRPYLFEKIREILTFFAQQPPNHRVKIGTVVSRVNLPDLPAIAKFLYRSPSQRPPDVWRLYQFEPLKGSKKVQERFAILEEAFLEVIDHLRRDFPEANISPRSNKDHQNAYFFVTPDGQLQLVDANRHYTVADLLQIEAGTLASLLTELQTTKERVAANREWLRDKAPKNQ